MEHNELGWAYKVIYDDLHICGCGYFDERMIILKESLNAFPLHNHKNIPDYLKTPLGEWFLTILENGGLIEHGTSIGGSWITPKGKRFLAVLNDETAYSKLVDDEIGNDLGYCLCDNCLKDIV